MRGPLALRALLVPLWTLPLVAALAVDTPVKVPRVAPASPRATDALLSFDVPALDGFGRTEPHYLHLKIGNVDTPCGTPDITVNGQVLSSSSVDSFDGDLVFHDLDLSVYRGGSHISTIEAIWSVSCLEDTFDIDPIDWDSAGRDSAGRDSQLLVFTIRQVDGRAASTHEVWGLTFFVRFRQTDLEILSITGPVTVVAEADFSSHLGAEEEMSLVANLIGLEELRQQLEHAKTAVDRKQRFIANAYGLDTSKTDEQGGCQLGPLHCAVQGVADRLKKVVFQVFGEERARKCGLFSWDESDQTESPGSSSTATIQRPKPTHEQPLVGASASSPGSSSSSSGAEAIALSSSSDDDGDNLLPYLIPIIAVIGLISMLHCCCVRWNARRASLEPWCNQTRREERRRRRAARCARAAERRAAVKASVRRFFRRVFCRAGLEDEEKEAERQRVLEDGHVPGAPTWRWVPISRPGQFNQVNAPPAELFSVGSGVDEEEEEEDHRHVLDRPRSIRDSESITLVGTEGSESGRDSYEEGEDDADDEKGHSLPESDDGASESGSESSVSDMSTTMEVDLARFRAVTVVVSNMVAAGEGMMRMREREREQQDAQSRNGWSRPLSPASSLPGYTSDDGLPPAYADTTHHGAAAELPDAVISNGFRYVPGGVWSPRP